MLPVSYRLAMPEPHTHLLEVEVRLDDTGDGVELVMPSWTPGSYLLREFARHVQDFRAKTDAGVAVPWQKTDKSTWRVEPAPGQALRVHYRVYANELTVRTSHLDATHAYVNGASVFMFVRGREHERCQLEIDAPPGWTATTTLTSAAPFHFSARDYDELVDSPIEIGTHRLLEWEHSGILHQYAIWGRGSYDAGRLVEDTRKIVAAAEAMFGGLPYPRYTFFLHLFPGGRGGLEHRDSSSLHAERWAFDGEEYENLLALVAHEHFHVWNAKRIRPEPLGPFDYTAENYTTSLWVMEGLTTYYTDLILRRAGIITPERYLSRLADAIARFQSQPGRHHQTLAESSFDTWIRFYRPDEHSPNSQISYYQKGALVGLLLDLEIRRVTARGSADGSSAGGRSLDDLMRLLWERYGQTNRGFPDSGGGSVEALAEEVAGVGLAEFFERYIRGTDELDYDRYLGEAGLRLALPRASAGTPKRATDGELLEARLGIRIREQGDRLKIVSVISDGPGAVAGLNAGDEVIAVDGLRVTSVTELAKRVWRLTPGTDAPLALFRRDELMTLSVPIGEGPVGKPRIERVPEPTPEQEAVYAAWLGTEPAAAATQG